MFLKIWITRRCDARHTKTRVMAEMKLQQAAKSLSKNEARWIAVNIVKVVGALLRDSLCRLLALEHLHKDLN
jgi:hypothetical protein